MLRWPVMSSSQLQASCRQHIHAFLFISAELNHASLSSILKPLEKKIWLPFSSISLLQTLSMTYFCYLQYLWLLWLLGDNREHTKLTQSFVDCCKQNHLQNNGESWKARGGLLFYSTEHPGKGHQDGTLVFWRAGLWNQTSSIEQVCWGSSIWLLTSYDG